MSWTPEYDFATRLLLVRRQLRLTRDQAADRCGLVARTWQTWESGVIPHDQAAVVDQIAERLGVDRDWLMWGTSDPAPPPDPRGRSRHEQNA